ncbi:MAG: geranylgeranylglycerol-phosphate geranylgeranyltransferase [Candidatus Hecatellaceae archaeon]
MKAKAYFRLLRPPNCAMMGLAVLVGEYLTLGRLDSWASLLGFLTAFTLTGGSMAANDYFDREVDRINEPTRPIPSGQVKPGEALMLASIMGLLGLFSAFASWIFFGGWLAPMVAGASFALAIYYNGWGKRFGLLGNLMVSACVAIPFLYGAFMVGVMPSLALMFFAAMAFLSNTGREVLKGMADVEGDRLRKVKTIAIQCGLKAAAIAASAFYVAAVVLSVFPPALNLVSVYYVPPVAGCCLGFAYISLKILSKPRVEEAKRLKKLSLLSMLLGLIGFMVGV